MIEYKLFGLCLLGISVLVSLAEECNNNHFQCEHTGKCIPVSWKCDEDFDCGENDTSDERKCPTKTCSSDEMKCGDDKGKCIPNRWQCDGEPDCDDGSDEDNTLCDDRTCKTDEFDCGDKVCVPHAWVCDGHLDCDSGKDEETCVNVTTCPSSNFRCESGGRCIDTVWYCDGDKDCLDGSDEKDCPKKECKEDEFKCEDSTKCIDNKWRCDGDFDCSDHSDERDCVGPTGSTELCPNTDFQCKTSKECIHKSWHCDGDPDCSDGSDENGDECDYTCPNDKFKCKNNFCIPSSLRCDHNKDCLDGSDEDNCTFHTTCGDDEFDCYGDGTECIPESKVCDGQNDCQHSEDEDRYVCKYKDPCLKTICGEHSHCQKITTHEEIIMTVAKCECDRGFEWHDKEKVCKDIDECQFEDRCSQICTNTKGGYKCTCLDGYTLEKFSFCRANGKQPWLYYANRRDIRRLSVDSRYMDVITDSDNSVALDIDFEQKILFWTDATLELIHSAELHPETGLVNNDKKSVVLKLQQGVSTPDGLAVDWLYKHIYWTDTGINTIHVANYDGSKTRTLISEDMDDPRAICLDPENGYMYWTDWGKDPKIERSGMDGNNRAVIVAESDGLEWPNGLTIDYIGKRIYWIDAKLHKIGTARMDGSDNKHVLVDAKEITQPFSISVFEDTLYWTDWHTNSIRSINKFNGRHPQTLSMASYSVMDIKVYHEMRQTVDFAGNASVLCNVANCEYLCLPAAADHTHPKVSCVCQDVYHLNDDHRTCSLDHVVPTTPKPEVTTQKPEPTTHKPYPTTHKPVVTKEPGYTVVVNATDKTPHVQPQEQKIGFIAAIAAGILVIVLIVGFIAGVCIYRRYNLRNKKSMNFDNPVYRKTTTTEEKCMIHNDSDLQPQLEPLTHHHHEVV